MAARSSLLLVAVAVLLPGVSLTTGSPTGGSKLARPRPAMPKPKLPPLGLGFDIYCRVCRHIFEVAAQRTWDFRDDYDRVEADLKQFCATAPEFQDPRVTGHQTCPILIPRSVGPIAEIIHRYAGVGSDSGADMESKVAAFRNISREICFEVHEACDRHGKAPSIYGDLEKLREEYPNVQQPEVAEKPKKEEGPHKGPPKISLEKAKTLLKKRRPRNTEL